MSQLAHIEADFQDYVISGKPTIAGEIAGPNDAFRATRLGIYFDAYRLRLAEVMGTDFPMLKAYVGDDVFDRLTASYIAAHPSIFRNVRWFSQHFAEHLQTSTDVTHHKVLAELAHFEWTLGLAFDIEDQPSLRFEELAAVAPEAWATVSFTPHPSLHLLALSTNAVAIWSAQYESADPVAPELLAEPFTCAVWRADYTSYFRSLDADAAWAVKAMQSDASFSQICEGLCQWFAEDEAAPRAAALLRGWVDDGWIAEVSAINER